MIFLGEVCLPFSDDMRVTAYVIDSECLPRITLKLLQMKTINR